MMKRKGYLVVVVALLCVALLTACGASSKYSLSEVGEVFASNGAVAEDPPLYQLIGATDGLMFYYEGSPVKLYEFADEEAMNAALEANEYLKRCEPKGLIILETNSQAATDLFNGI